MSSRDIPIRNIAGGNILSVTLRFNAATKITYAGIRNSNSIRTMLLLVAFIRYVPQMLKRGKMEGSSKKAFSVVVN
jgi:hypothetical protein